MLIPGRTVLFSTALVALLFTVGGCKWDWSPQDPCGNGKIDESEQCDGDELAGETCQGAGFERGDLGCQADCGDYDYSGCVGCGDGVLQPNEACDDANFDSEDGCDGDCQVELGWECGDTLPSVCTSNCGDGLLAAGAEECDDGNADQEDGCDWQCAVEPEWICDGQSPTQCTPDCGNGICQIDYGESRTSCVADCGFVQVSVGFTHTCAVMADGSAWCWGDNVSCQTGAEPAGGVVIQQPVRVTGLGQPVAEIAAGAYFTCARLQDGTARCWGAGSVGQLGNGSTPDHECTPAPVDGLSGLTAIAAGGASQVNGFGCAVVAGGEVFCWGAGGGGNLGDGFATDRSAPVQVEGLTGVVAVSTGAHHACALTAGGAAWCWGRNQHGELGIGSSTGPDLCDTTPCALSPQQVTGLGSGVTEISAGGSFSCAVAGGQTWCWGSNAHGKLGVGQPTGPETCASIDDCSTVPVQLSFSFEELSLGFDHGCGLDADDTARCWGSNESGILGIGDLWVGEETSPAPVLTPVGGVVDQVSADNFTSCALLADGSIWCWGSNWGGSLGVGRSGTDEATPMQVVDP